MYTYTEAEEEKYLIRELISEVDNSSLDNSNYNSKTHFPFFNHCWRRRRRYLDSDHYDDRRGIFFPSKTPTLALSVDPKEV